LPEEKQIKISVHSTSSDHQIRSMLVADCQPCLLHYIIILYNDECKGVVIMY